MNSIAHVDELHHKLTLKDDTSSQDLMNFSFRQFFPLSYLPRMFQKQLEGFAKIFVVVRCSILTTSSVDASDARACDAASLLRLRQRGESSGVEWTATQASGRRKRERALKAAEKQHPKHLRVEPCQGRCRKSCERNSRKRPRLGPHHRLLCVGETWHHSTSKEAVVYRLAREVLPSVAEHSWLSILCREVWAQTFSHLNPGFDSMMYTSASWLTATIPFAVWTELTVSVSMLVWFPSAVSDL